MYYKINSIFLKKVLIHFSIFVILFSSFSTSVIALNQVKITWYNSVGFKQNRISENTLKKLIVKKSFTRKGLSYLLKIKWITKNDLILIKNKKVSRNTKLNILKKLYKWWLTNSQISYLKSNKWFTKIWLSLIWWWVQKMTLSQKVQAYKKLNKWSFLEKYKWQPGVYKVNFKDITSSNAWKVQASFVGKSNFPKKLILPEWFTYEVKNQDLDREFIKTNSLLSKINTLKNQNIKFWEVNISTPELKVLPDRVQYVKKVEISFSSNEELKKLKENLWTEFDFSDVNISNLKSKLKQDQKLNKLKNNLQSKELNFANKIANTTKLQNALNNRNIAPSSGDKNILNTVDDNKIYEDLIKVCKSHYGNNSDKCSLTKLKKTKKTITLEDKIEYSLIPTTLEDIKNKNILIKKSASLVRLNATNIYTRFANLWEFNIAMQDQENHYNSNWNPPKHDIDAADYCEILYKNDETKKASCKERQEEMKKITTANYSKKLLNGFTLWESKNYHWGTSLKVDLLFDTVKVFEIGFDLYYSYGFWIRIPMEVTWKITDNIVNDYKSENTIFTWSVKLNTFDGDEDFYRQVWLVNSKVFEWKEFVFEVSAGAKFHVWVKYLGSFDQDIPFITILATIFRDDLQDSLWLSDSQIQSVIDNNGIDKSKNFTPPFAGENTVELFRFLSPEIPFYNNWAVKFVWKLWVKSTMDGRITMKCITYNSNGWCMQWDSASSIWTTESSINIWADSSRVHIDTRDWYNGYWNAIYNPDSIWASEDILWNYGKFGLKFSDFRYHPILVFTIFAKAWLGANIPLGVGWKTYWTPDIDIYKFKFSSDDLYLWTHEWTDWNFDMIDNNIIYSTVSTLEDIQNIQVSKIWWKYLSRSSLIINPEVNTQSSNRTYYRLDWKMPYSTFWNCGLQDEEGTKLYTKPVTIWPNAKNELVNSKTFDLYAKSCDLLANKQNGSERIKHKVNKIFIKNYYHKVFPSASEDIVISNTNVLPLKLEEYDTINADVRAQCSPYFYLTANSENSNYYIKYNIIEEWEQITNQENNTAINSNINSSLTNQNLNISESNLNNANIIAKFPDCNSNIWKEYKWEQIIFATDTDNNSLQIANRMIENNPNSILIKKEATIYAVKCIWKKHQNQRWQVFQSLLTTIKLNVKKQWICNAQQDDMVDEASYDSSVWWMINDIKQWWIGWDWPFDAWLGQVWWWQNVMNQNWFNWNIPWTDQFNWEGKFGNWPQIMNFNGGPISPKDEKDKKNTSTDEYVNKKLQEINDCFINTYNSHLENIDKTIKRFEDIRNSSRDEKIKRKYQKAIDKLNEIKTLFITRYSFLRRYKK